MDNCIKNYPVNMFRVCIDSCAVDISGYAYSPLCEEEIVFTGIGELLLKMDKLFDAVGYPQGFQDKRSFENAKRAENAYRGIPKAVRPAEDILERKGACCTFDIMVESRRNTSWQGVIYEGCGEERGRFDGEVALLEQIMNFAKG